MKLFGGMMADRLLAGIRTPGDLEGDNGRKAAARLRKIGVPALRKTVGQLETADEDRMQALSRLLGVLISPGTLSEAVALLSATNANGMKGLVWALS
ncbi:MAG: hypothetical protein PVI87_07875, partial [Gammaproteobacteria bacterium]